MSEKVLKMLEGKIDRTAICAYLESDIKEFNFLVQLMQKADKPSAWRAAWIIHHIIKRNDVRVQKSLTNIILSIKGKEDGHQRELIKIVRKMKLNEKDEGLFFDVCMNIWEDVKKQPAARFYCGLFIIEIAKKYPELKNELDYLTEDYYTQTLSPGIKRIFKKALSNL